MEGEGSVIIQGGGRGYFGRVRVAYSLKSEDLASQHTTPILDPPWPELLEPAECGAQLGLELAGVMGKCIVLEVRVHEVSAPHDRIVTVAAVRAAWAAVGFTPSPDLAGRLESCVRRFGPASAIREWMTSTDCRPGKVDGEEEGEAETGTS